MKAPLTSLMIKGTPLQGLFGATVGFFIGFAAVALFGPSANYFQEIMKLSPTQVGFLVAIPSLSGSLFRIPFAAWVDTTGGRTPFIILLILAILGMVGLLFCVHQPDLSNVYFPLILFLGILTGCGIATFSVGIAQVSYWFPQKMQGKALGIYAGVGNMAPGLFSLLIPLASSNLGLQNTYLIWLSILAMGTAAYFFLGKNAWYFQYLKQNKHNKEEAQEKSRSHGQEVFPARSLMESLGISASVWQTWGLVVLYFCTFGGFIALTAWFPTYWKSFFLVSPEIAGVLTALYSMGASIIRVFAGGVSDRLGGEQTALLSLGVMLIGSITLAFSYHIYLSIVGTVIMAIGMGANNAAVFKILPRVVSKAVGGAAGWVGGLGAFGGFAIPPIMGYFVAEYGTHGYPLGFVAFIGLSLVALVQGFILFYTPRRSSKIRTGHSLSK